MSRSERRAYRRLTKNQDPYAPPAATAAARARMERQRTRRSPAARGGGSTSLLGGRTGWVVFGGGAAVFLLDLAKGIAAVLLAAWLYRGPGAGWIAAGSGVAAIIGHIRSAFIGFRGGRGVATAAGGLLAIAPLAVVVLAPVVVAVIWRWRYVSLGSIS